MSSIVLPSTKKTDFCPKCGAELVIRSGKKGAFLRCSTYPGCNFIRSLKNQANGHIVTILAQQSCPECHSELVLRQGIYGMFIGCRNYPLCEHTAPTEHLNKTSSTCPNCNQGKLVQRRSRYGKTFFACERYPDCQFAVNFTPFAGKCAFCHFPLLVQKKTSQGLKLFCASKLCNKLSHPEIDNEP